MIRGVFLLIAIATVSVPRSSPAAPLVADLSSPVIAITTGFSGAELLLFGATDGPGDVIVIVRGPRRDETVRRKDRVAGLWVNRHSLRFKNIPAYFAVAATRPLNEIAGRGTLRRNRIGPVPIALAAEEGADPAEVKPFREALIRNKRRAGLYSRTVGEVRLIEGRLFRTTIVFPASVPTGRYSVSVYFARKGRIAARKTTALTIRKVGAEARIFAFAHDKSAAYGAIAILIALVAGWVAGLVFRKT